MSLGLNSFCSSHSPKWLVVEPECATNTPTVSAIPKWESNLYDSVQKGFFWHHGRRKPNPPFLSVMLLLPLYKHTLNIGPCPHPLPVVERRQGPANGLPSLQQTWLGAQANSGGFPCQTMPGGEMIERLSKTPFKPGR